MVDTITSGIGGINNSAALPSSNSRQELVENFDTFLQLLVAQIQNQDPTDPVETETFTNQLVQFSELEQSIQSNDNLETILTSIESQNAANIVSYIGQTVNAFGSTSTLRNGEALFDLQAAGDAVDAEISIRDNLGILVFQTNRPLEQGSNQFVYDGSGPNNVQFPDGQEFTINVVAVDANGSPVNVRSAVNGVVDGVDFSGSTPNLLVDGRTIPVTSVQSVSQTF